MGVLGCATVPRQDSYRFGESEEVTLRVVESAAHEMGWAEFRDADKRTVRVVVPFPGDAFLARAIDGELVIFTVDSQFSLLRRGRPTMPRLVSQAVMQTLKPGYRPPDSERASERSVWLGAALTALLPTAVADEALESLR